MTGGGAGSTASGSAGPAAHSVAERLYYGSAELEFSAVVTDIRLVATSAATPDKSQAQLWKVALDRTAFYPEGGGQPWDTGVLVATSRSGAVLEVPVERVKEDEDTGEVWHFVRKPLVEGTEVEGRVDAARRVDHEQQHSGQHLLSAMFVRELGARTVSFHLGEESSTIDLALDGGAERLSDEELARVEEAANRVVYEGRPLHTHWVEREFAQIMLERGDLRKLPERPGRMRIVQMQGIEFNACGGTHVGNTGAIGAIAIRRVEKVRQSWRVEFCCGLRAVRAARRDYGLLGEAARGMSVGAADVPARVAVLLEEFKAAAKEKSSLLDDLAKAEADALAASAPPGAAVQAVFSGRDVEFGRRVVAKLAELGRGAVVGVMSGAEGSVVMSRPPGSVMHSGQELQRVLGAAGGRGGGSPERAQGVCAGGQVAEVVARLADVLNDAAGVGAPPQV